MNRMLYNRKRKVKMKMIDYLLQDPNYSNLSEFIKSKRITIIDGTAISEYMFNGTGSGAPKSEWSFEDFTLLPPLKRCWVDFKAPEKVIIPQLKIDQAWLESQPTNWAFDVLWLDSNIE